MSHSHSQQQQEENEKYQKYVNVPMDMKGKKKADQVCCRRTQLMMCVWIAWYEATLSSGNSIIIIRK